MSTTVTNSGNNSPHRTATPDLRDPLRRHYSLLSSPRRSVPHSPSHRTTSTLEGLRTPLRRAKTSLPPSLTTGGGERTVATDSLPCTAPTVGNSSTTPTPGTTITGTKVPTPLPTDPRRTKSLANLGSVQKADTTQPWKKEDWITLSRYYEAVGRDIEQTVKVFYRHESLQFEETENGRSQMIIESWPKERIRWHVRCLDAATKKHQGKPLLERVRAFEFKKKKNSFSSTSTSSSASSSVKQQRSSFLDVPHNTNTLSLSTALATTPTRKSQPQQQQ
ncbi:hypothetical protein BDA99DRAFT_514940 [Phascolomyces articulosus]|uniref:Uncharacterized protein n=1 Tax=Phascolomyces articulosus TaxID=60185 RepID=A0AAD5JWS1_9FUNG|nr:hypothetical protein BDA99DRAFT_514940 [Phascolomyces articulosus]